MRKNAFTLIELLAVIVILAIIALIATPIVINIIKDTKRNSFIQTINGIIDAAEYYYANEMLNGEKLRENLIFRFPNEIEGLEFDGEVPKDGFIQITTDGKIVVGVSNNNYCVTKGYSDTKVTSTEDIENCIFPDFVNGIMSSFDICIINGTCDNGTLVKVQVNSEENYNFYTIKDENNELTLIMDRNLGGNVAWVNQNDYEKAGGSNWTGKTDRGPLTALNALESRTSRWTNIAFFDYILTDSIYGTIQRLNVRARLITNNELKSQKTLNNNVMPDYLYKNLRNHGDNSTDGYWTSTAVYFREDSPYYVSYEETIRDCCTVNTNSGVRPVINISK